ncbi:MAG: GGDEF domain-containing protein [Magnetococcales bacterium]|nr:GGDEF domain-containing protein [Magnetococcales bacterium]
MWKNRSLIFPAISALVLAIFATLCVGFFVNYAILKDVLQERVIAQASGVTSSIEKDLANRVDHLSGFKNSWMANLSWAMAEAPASIDRDAQAGVPTMDPMVSSWQKFQDIFPLWQLDFLLVANSQGEVVRYLPADWQLEKKLADTLLTDLTAHSGKIRTTKVGDVWTILFSDFLKKGESDQYRVMFGYHLNTVVRTLAHEHTNHPFILADENSLLGDQSVINPEAGHVNMDLVRNVLTHGESLVDFDNNRDWNLYYASVSILNTQFCLVMPVNLATVRAILADSRIRLLGSMVFIIGILVLLGIALQRTILAPLHILRDKAATMVAVCSGNEQTLELNRQMSGNEIDMLTEAYEAAAIKLVTHVSHLTNAKDLLESLNLKDQLTELGNRQMFDEFLNRALSQYGRKNARVAVLVMDLDQFDVVNRQYSRDHGDAMLKEVADRFINTLRSEDLVFRIGEDEFAAFIPECGDDKEIMIVGHRLYDALAAPYIVDDERITIGVSIGISVFPDVGTNVEDLITVAEQTLNAIKRQGGDHCRLYSK